MGWRASCWDSSSASWRVDGWSNGRLLALVVTSGRTALANAKVSAPRAADHAVRRSSDVLGTGEGFRERGFASWYGPGFHGRLTANGETYDMYAMTAAHRTLPIPSYLEV